MPRWAWVNGRFLRHDVAAVPVEDRGLQFADSVYEVWALRDGRLMDAAAHLARLDRSLSAIAMPRPLGNFALMRAIGELVRRNRLRDGLVYLQVTRGDARRDHAFPPGLRPNVMLTARPFDMRAADRRAEAGISVITAPDLRWRRVDVKTTGLLANVLAKQAALDAGCGDAWLVDEHGLVTEGTAQNAWIVDADGVLRTRPLGHDILPGVTRARVMALAPSLAGGGVEERAFSVAEAKAAREAFITSATSFVMPVVQLDGAAIGDGRPGPLARALRAAYLAANAAEPVAPGLSNTD